MILNINYHVWFKVARFARRKYKLSTNCVIVLNGAYVYNSCIKKGFTRYSLLKFVCYYNNVRLGKYISVLLCNGFICESGMYRGHQLYCISSKGIEVIEELNKSYEVEFNKFVEQYNISL